MRGTYRLSAEHRSEHDSASAQQALTASLPTLAPMVVRAAVAQGIAAPSSRVHVEVSVRTADGRPVSQARVHSPFIPRVRGVSEQPTVLTDARGRAHFEFVAPELRQQRRAPRCVHQCLGGTRRFGRRQRGRSAPYRSRGPLWRGLGRRPSAHRGTRRPRVCARCGRRRCTRGRRSCSAAPGAEDGHRHGHHRRERRGNPKTPKPHGIRLSGHLF